MVCGRGLPIGQAAACRLLRGFYAASEGLGTAEVLQHYNPRLLWNKGKGSPFENAAVKCPAYNDIDTNQKKNTIAGYCIIADTDGDQAYLRFQALGDTKSNPGTFEYTGGTGKYKGISGSNTFVAVTQVNWTDGTASGYATSKSLNRPLA